MLTYLLIATAVAVVVAVLVVVPRLFRKAPTGQALIVASPLGARRVVMGSDHALVLPLVGRAEALDLGPVELVIERQGWAGLVFADQERVDVTARLTVKLEPEPEHLLRMARLMGGRRATDPQMLSASLGPALSHALKLTAARMGDECLHRRETLCQRALKVLAEDLHGYTLEALKVEFPGLPEVKRRDGPFR